MSDITNEELGFVVHGGDDIVQAASEPKYHHYDIYGRYSYSSDVANDRCTEVRPEALSNHYNWNDVEWVYAPDVLSHPIGNVTSPPNPS